MRLIGFFQMANFIRGELDRDGCDSIIQVMRLGRADKTMRRRLSSIVHRRKPEHIYDSMH